jgi:hypothetical protein
MMISSSLMIFRLVNEYALTARRSGALAHRFHDVAKQTAFLGELMVVAQAVYQYVPAHVLHRQIKLEIVQVFVKVKRKARRPQQRHLLFVETDSHDAPPFYPEKPAGFTIPKRNRRE